MKKTLIAVGDHERDILFRKYFHRNLDILIRKGIIPRTFSYSQIFENPSLIDDVDSEKVTVLFFFPYEFWDSHIETGDEMYGNKGMGERFEEFYNQVGSIFISRHKCKVSYVNDPVSIPLVRDKKRSHDVLGANGVPCPKSYNGKTAEELAELAEQGTDLILKVRCGSLGKGISYLSKKKWCTNFKYENGVLSNHPDDEGWIMMEIPQDIDFLKKLLEADVHVEEEIKTPPTNGQKLDLRVYVIYQDPVLVYTRTAPVGRIVTNWYQGGRIEPLSFLDRLPPKAIEMAKDTAVKAANAYGLGYAGIDVILSENYEKAFVLEGNAFPGVPSPEIPSTVFDPMRTLLEKIV